MYSRSIFKMTETDCLMLIEQQPFGLLTTCRDGRITQAFLPFLIDKSRNCLYGHLAKNNQQIAALEDPADLKVTFQGTHSYISPNWYESLEQVPTWNYLAVEVQGAVTLLDSKGTLKVITDLSNKHESPFEKPWTMDKLSEKKTNVMLKAIVGFRINISAISGINKMSQNKNNKDIKGVLAGLLNQPDQASKGVAKIMFKRKG